MAKFTDNLWYSIRLEAKRRYDRQNFRLNNMSNKIFKEEYPLRRSLEYYCAQVAYEYSENGIVR